ncbi:16S rRNA (cytosine(1402)-N(4))-methyltransferase [Thiocapsa imhoffii]|uniref:Ribosomal RNA small subunit methyltransferase H n=1 Tax=Thiocapsa imhoffii TaxID=382777 RepID=A0A9X0WF48_9GAMM|nr:16S rRNA (cytosine(1402)-N(4))-methyltransferase [Thiocapsa imhoffii]
MSADVTNLQSHQPVLLEESVQALVADPNGVYVDGTFGRGGHSRAILSRLSAQGRLIGVDRDPEAVAAGQVLAATDPRFAILSGRFGSLGSLLGEAGFGAMKLSGLLLDLGVSSPQLDTPERGFSFLHEGPLDLRMDPRTGLSAAQWLAQVTEAELIRVLREFGEERFAKRIARQILDARAQRELRTTTQLAALVARAVPTREAGKHPATRTFQAVRMCVNDELLEIQDGLRQSSDLLAHAGRLVVISFHSLEDRLVKRFMRAEARGPQFPKGVPIMASDAVGRLRVLGRPIRASAAEVAANPRARSAIMRIAERLS